MVLVHHLPVHSRNVSYDFANLRDDPLNVAYFCRQDGKPSKIPVKLKEEVTFEPTHDYKGEARGKHLCIFSR